KANRGVQTMAPSGRRCPGEKWTIQREEHHETTSDCIRARRQLGDGHDGHAAARTRSLGLGLGPRRICAGRVCWRCSSSSRLCVWLLPRLFLWLRLSPLFLRLWVPSVFLRVCLPRLFSWLLRLLWRLSALLPYCLVWRLSGRPTRCDPSRSLALRRPEVSRHK